jgi:TM2 domain-containing membrane protein YozV
MSAFLPGAGQIYAHRTARGLILLVATLALAPIYIGIGLWIWQIFDAASCVKRGL